MRWLCSAAVRKQMAEMEDLDTILRRKMRSQGIKQLKDKHIENRIEIVKAWKLAGGGTKWQATANTYKALTGKDITRQAVRDMILRLNAQKLVRLRRGKKRLHEPLLES